MNSVSPLKKSQRLMWIDAARGFAILGIFVVNIGAFSAPYFLHGGAEPFWSSAVDVYTQTVIDIFFQASFYTLFSLLFGFGLQILIERLTEKGIAIYPFLFRRLIILIGIGMIHAFLIWHGDILLSYGIVGLFFITFVGRHHRTILIWASLLLFLSVYAYTNLLYESRAFLGSSDTAGIQQAFEHYRSGDLSVILGQNLQDWMYTNSLFSYVLLGTTLLPLFLFGMYIARKRWLHNPLVHKKPLLTGWIVSLILFITLKMGPYAYGNPEWFSYVQDNIGGTASALFYLFSITLLAQTHAGKVILKPFSYVGCMSLTNYILQSLICFVLFYGVGFGLYGAIRPIEAMGIVVIVYSLQIIFSKWWMRRFRYGPLEWIWRNLTYMQKQKLRKKG